MSDSLMLARRMRCQALKMVARANTSHIGSALSCTDILAVLYSGFLRIDPNNPRHPDRDRLLVSKGHAAVAVYSALAEQGFFPVALLETYCQDGSALLGHIEHKVPGVEISSGSLGHALSVGCGLALAARADGSSRRNLVLLSDGELDEGSNWEAILFAGHFQLSNLTVIVDANGLQGLDTIARVIKLDPLKEKFLAFGWSVRDIDGHDHNLLHQTFSGLPWEQDKPNVLIAQTVKGKGVSFMENKIQWHYKSPTPEQLLQALREIEET